MELAMTSYQTLLPFLPKPSPVRGIVGEFWAWESNKNTIIQPYEGAWSYM
jgi:hypothetical protein